MRISDWSSDVCSSDLISDIGGCCVTGRPLHPRLGIGVRAHPFRHRAGPCPCYLLIKAVLRCQTAQRRRHSGGIVTRTRKILDSKVVRLCFLASGITERNELGARADRSEEHTSELQSLMRIQYAVFCLKKKKSAANKTQRKTT